MYNAKNKTASQVPGVVVSQAAISSTKGGSRRAPSAALGDLNRRQSRVSPRLVALLGSALAGAAAFPAHAQTSSAAEPTQSLEEVVVTAERRSENLQRTAVSVSVRSGEELQREGKFSLTDIIEGIPGVSGMAATGGGAGTDAAATGIIIRGVGSNTAVAGGISSVVPATALYVDGIVSGAGGDYDIDRVEVLRGPQGTLYGRSATAGVVAIHTRDPKLDRIGGNVSLEAGNYNLRHASGGVNFPIGDTLALRVSGNRYTRDGYNAKKGGGANTGASAASATALRAKLLFKPSNSLSALLGFAYQENDTYSGERVGVLTGPDTIVYKPTGQGSGNNKTYQYWAKVDWDLGPATLTYLPALRTWEQNAIIIAGVAPIAIRQTISTPYDHFLTQELRLASNGQSSLKWQSGLYYYKNNLRNHSVIVLNGVQNQAADTEKQTKALGAFGEATYAFTDALRLTTGLRYDRTEVITSEHFVPRTGAPFDLSADEGTRKFNNTTYKLRLEGDFTPTSLGYASVSTGFLPGDVGVVNGSNGQAVVAPFEAETLTSYEIGSKNRFFEDRLQVNGGVYYYRYGGYQSAGINVSSDPLNPEYLTLTAPARMIGAELETLWKPTRADRVGLDVSYVDARYVNKPALFATNVYQEKIPQVSPVNAKLSYSRELRMFRGQRLSIGGEALYRSARDVSIISTSTAGLGYSAYAHVGSQITGNMNVNWTITQNVSLAGYVRNVANNRYKASASVTAAAQFGELSDPRTYGLALNLDF